MQSKAYNAVFCTLCDRLSGSSAKCKLNLTHFPFGSQKAKFSGAKIAKGACTTYTKISAKFLHLCQQTKPWHFTFSLLFRAASALFLPSPPTTAMTTARNFYDPFTDLARFHGDLPKSGESIAALCPTPPLPHFQSGRILPVFVVYGGGNPPGISRPVKIRKHRLFAYHYGAFSENAFAGRNVA